MIDALQHIRGDGAIVGRVRLAGHVGRGRHNWLAEAPDERLTVRVFGYANARRAITGQNASIQTDDVRVDHRKRANVDVEKGLQSWMEVIDVTLEHIERINEDDEPLTCRPLLELQHPRDGCTIGSVAADAPDCVGGVEDYLTVS